jgi:hypothetical protein
MDLFTSGVSSPRQQPSSVQAQDCTRDIDMVHVERNIPVGGACHERYLDTCSLDSSPSILCLLRGLKVSSVII